ncbi:MAG TPA: transglutaminase domain-containing protein [Spirochaetia bacterium]|nr:transglutaminase domain-containing protein [Spirochaetia bacterium]
MANENTSPQIKIEFKQVLPYLVFGFLVFILLISSGLTSRPPEVETISPEIAETGAELIIKGKFFGDQREGGRIVVSNVSPPSSSYLEWSDRKISLIVPEEMSGGLLKVVTKHGESRKVIVFTNKRHLPVVAAGPLKPGEPYISGIQPENGPVGTLVTIRGLNFGLKRGDSRVSFTWTSGSKNTIEVTREPNVVLIQDIDHNYVSWDDREIKIRVPDGSSSGSLKVITDKGGSNAVYFEVQDTVGTKAFNTKRVYHVQYSVEITNVAAEPGNGLYLWVPLIMEIPQQRDIEQVIEEREAMFDNFEGYRLFFLKDLEAGGTYRLNMSFIFSRYTVETNINAARVKDNYDKENKLYNKYTLPNSLVSSSDKNIVSLSQRVTGLERNPYRKAGLIYTYITKRLNPVSQTGNRDLMKAVNSQEGDPYIYALLFCALGRSADIPSRPIGGYIVDDNGNAHRHYWAEFYIESFGWVPVDPFLGDGFKYGGFPVETDVRSYYFGNLDNRHITLSKDLVILRQMNPKGRLVTRTVSPSFQTIHEEYTGNLSSYSSQWSDLKILGIY